MVKNSEEYYSDALYQQLNKFEKEIKKIELKFSEENLI